MIRRFFALAGFFILSAFFVPATADLLSFDLPAPVLVNSIEFERLDVPDPGRTPADQVYSIANQPLQDWRRAADGERFERLDVGWRTV